jgi:hypothetical protein
MPFFKCRDCKHNTSCAAGPKLCRIQLSRDELRLELKSSKLSNLRWRGRRKFRRCAALRFPTFCTVRLRCRRKWRCGPERRSAQTWITFSGCSSLMTRRKHGSKQVASRFNGRPRLRSESQAPKRGAYFTKLRAGLKSCPFPSCALPQYHASAKYSSQSCSSIESHFAFRSAIHLSVRASRRSSGSVPPSSISSWKVRISNFGPNSFWARSRSSRNLS